MVHDIGGKLSLHFAPVHSFVECYTEALLHRKHKNSNRINFGPKNNFHAKHQAYHKMLSYKDWLKGLIEFLHAMKPRLKQELCLRSSLYGLMVSWSSQ